jgi:serine phosphatase RsbU (regulator of sigma subunit)
MASLHILRGVNQGQRIALDGDRVLLGRSPECQVVIPITSVSRQHARIIRVQDHYYIEDMQSRNGTYLNNERIGGRTLLQPNDRIRICDFMAVFLGADTATMAFEWSAEWQAAASNEPPSSNLDLGRGRNTKIFLAQPADNLKVILEISNHLSKTLELEPLLPLIVDSLLQLFPHAGRCFLILAEESTGELTPKVVRVRDGQPRADTTFSHSIIRQCMESGQAFLGDLDSEGTLPDSSSVVTLGLHSAMCAPLSNAEGKAFGVLELDIQQRGRNFNTDDLTLLAAVANQASIALENARMYQQMQAREEVELQLEMAAHVQRSILPEHLPDVPGYEFFAHYESALEVGGDYYDFIALPRKRWAVTLGDVVGKGMPAALLMSKLSSDIRYCLLAETDPAAAFARLNNMVYKYTIRTDRFVTLAAFLLDPATQDVTLLNAGHPKPLLYRKSSGTLHEAFANSVPGSPLGVERGRRYDAGQFRLHVGDCLLMYTDGVTDAVNDKRERFGVQGIYNALPKSGDYTPSAMGQRLVDAVAKHAAGCPQQDDITVVCFGKTKS